VVDKEAGGITQHIGAYQVFIGGKKITFIDTPGHEAFTAMRARGSQVTDIVVLVVAADDGVMPQTIEALEHAKAAKVPVIVAVNKIDKPEANPDKVRHELSKYGLVPEQWGGDTIYVNVSALTGQGVSELLEMIQLQAELMDLKADPSAPPFGVVLESQIDPGLGIVATVLVQQGTFRRAMYILSGESVGRIRIMHDDLGKEVDEAVPSTPVRIVGFASLPENGERVYAFEDKRKAEQIAEARKAQRELEVMRSSALKISLDDVFKRIKEGQLRELPVVVKADVQGSAEAIRDALERISVEGTKVQVIRSGVGQITESDVMLASASNAIIIGFSVGATAQAKRLAEQEKVQIKYYDIIYKLTEEIELALKGLLEPEIVEIPLGIVEVRAVFRQEKSSAVVGGMVVSGKVHRGALYRLKRNGNVLFEGELASLRRFKDDVKEVAEGFECGLLLEGTNDVQEGDILEFFTKETRSPFEATTPSSESS
jgi:translation initiation factor IF-2